jgi:hypothetical protein
MARLGDTKVEERLVYSAQIRMGEIRTRKPVSVQLEHEHNLPNLRKRLTMHLRYRVTLLRKDLVAQSKQNAVHNVTQTAFYTSDINTLSNSNPNAVAPLQRDR